MVESIGCKQVTARKYSEYNAVYATCALNIKSAEIAVILQFMLLNFWDDFYVERLFWLFPGYFYPNNDFFCWRQFLKNIDYIYIVTNILM